MTTGVKLQYSIISDEYRDTCKHNQYYTTTLVARYS